MARHGGGSSRRQRWGKSGRKGLGKRLEGRGIAHPETPWVMARRVTRELYLGALLPVPSTQRAVLPSTLFYKWVDTFILSLSSPRLTATAPFGATEVATGVDCRT